MPRFLQFPILAAALAISGCGTKPLDCEWLSAQDSLGQELSSLGGFRQKNINARFVLANNQESLVLGVQSSDEALQRQLREAGVAISLTDEADPENELRIRFPLGMQHGREEGAPRFLPGSEMPTQQMMQLMDRPADRVEIQVGRGHSPRVMSCSEAREMGIDAGMSGSAFSFEYHLALRFDSLARWMTPGRRVQLTLDSDAVKQPRAREGERPDFGKKDPGGMGGMGGGRPGGGGGPGGPPPGGQRPDAPKQGKAIHIKQIIVLASGPPEKP